MKTTNTTTIEIPSELTENTYFSYPQRTANQRRAKEEKKLETIKWFFIELDLDVEMRDNSVVGTTINDFGDLYFEYTYSESCKNVYKKFEIYVDGSKKNITFLKKMLDPKLKREEKLKKLLKK